MKETRFNIGVNTLKQIDGLHGEEVYNTLYRVFDDEKEVRIYNIFSQRQDYLQLLQGL